MTYKLEFEVKAKREWDKLDNNIKLALKEVLAKRLINPIIPKDRLSGTGQHECYKIKLRSFGYRLIYKVERNKVILIVIAIEAYKLIIK
ncbi:MAG TPA: type II toxin-antitoxin system RelE/ParE family toxin [Burkholderiales bacterium]|nr:type II toxin-antitoxin system RelE/ParE family toxin [Burkholderiales bacterium]